MSQFCYKVRFGTKRDSVVVPKLRFSEDRDNGTGVCGHGIWTFCHKPALNEELGQKQMIRDLDRKRFFIKAPETGSLGQTRRKTFIKRCRIGCLGQNPKTAPSDRCLSCSMAGVRTGHHGVAPFRPASCAAPRPARYRRRTPLRLPPNHPEIILSVNSVPFSDIKIPLFSKPLTEAGPLRYSAVPDIGDPGDAPARQRLREGPAGLPKEE